ncbi:hypothetical protein V6U90_14120 [Micromonospora sp. CPCC 206060]|uniref:hypothetical protein n=1 Tax=Micromonospora sp. CPCC 206060 TaxID=3122406 RepID=UPI002FF2E0CF
MSVATENQLKARDLDRGDNLAAARVFTAAFMDDPIWQATGPTRSWHRRLVLTALYYAEVLIARGRKAVLLGAYRGERLDGVIIVFPDGERGLPWWGWVLRSVAIILAGPRVTARSLTVSNALDRLHPKQAHAHFWLIGSRPDSLGAGYLLMRAATARIDRIGRPGYLEATSPEMAEVKELLGWRVRERYTLPTGAVVTTMWRDCPSRV